MMEARKERLAGSNQNPVPIFDMKEIQKSKNLLRLKTDCEERARSRSRPGVGEVQYVDPTRKVGVVMGVKDIGADMKKGKGGNSR